MRRLSGERIMLREYKQTYNTSENGLTNLMLNRQSIVAK